MSIITTRQIAELAQVSRTTVSRVINNYQNVSLETKEKVLKIIDEYGYTPNQFARTLAGKSPNIIGVFIADINANSSYDKWIGINSPYNMQLLSVIINKLKEYNHTALVTMITDSKEYKSMENYFATRTISGGILIGFPYKIKILYELAQKYNIVLIDQVTFEENVNNQLKIVNSDNVLGGYIATKHLISYGHTSILHISGDNRLSSIEREQGYCQAMLEHNLQIKVINGLYREEIAYKKTKEYFAHHSNTAIFAANDIVAVGVIRALTELNLSVPENVSIVGFDNLDFITWFNINLTTMEVSLKEIGESSVDLLFDNNETRYKTCKPHLIKRQSTMKIK